MFSMQLALAFQLLLFGVQELEGLILVRLLVVLQLVLLRLRQSPIIRNPILQNLNRKQQVVYNQQKLAKQTA